MTVGSGLKMHDGGEPGTSLAQPMPPLRLWPVGRHPDFGIARL